MRILSVVVLAFGVAVAAGCAGKIGTKFDTGYVSKIERGQTTKQEIIDHLGKPGAVSTTSHGETWTYSYTEQPNAFDTMLSAYGAKSYDIKSEGLMITFEGDRVKDYTYSTMNK